MPTIEALRSALRTCTEPGAPDWRRTTTTELYKDFGLDYSDEEDQELWLCERRVGNTVSVAWISGRGICLSSISMNVDVHTSTAEGWMSRRMKIEMQEWWP